MENSVRRQTAQKVIQIENTGMTTCYEFSPDGRLALSGGNDMMVRHWDLETGLCLHTLRGHTGGVWCVGWSADQRLALSGSQDRTLRLWDVEAGRCLQVLEGHRHTVFSVCWSADQRLALSGSWDHTIRLWEPETGCCLRLLEGHTDAVLSLAWSQDQRLVFSGSGDNTVRVWDLMTGKCLVLEGHTDSVECVTCTRDHRRALSSSRDNTVRLWDVEAGRCLFVFEGHLAAVRTVAWRADERYALSGSFDETVRLWNLETGRSVAALDDDASDVRTVAWAADGRHAFSGDLRGGIRVWDLSESVAELQAGATSAGVVVQDSQEEALDERQADYDMPAAATSAMAQVQYTNAKVLVVGESGAGKTGLTERLAQDTFSPSYSTSGAWSTQWHMKDLPAQQGWEREVWLWDFGGQADQRLIHQLYLDKTALVLLVFNADRDVVLPGLREWQQALSRCVRKETHTFVVAGRVDVGMRFDREKVREFAQKNGYGYFETSASDGRGCVELRRAIQEGIPWNELERRTSPVTWKLLKDEIVKLRDEGLVLFTFKELRETLRQRVTRFTDLDLETVIGLLDGPGVVKELSFGTYVLLRPEWINAYAQAVIRTMRSDDKVLGCMPVQGIAEGKLIFAEEKRLGPREEPIVLQAMEQTLLERKLCLRQGGNLVFPSYCGIEKPVGPVPPKYFISYVFGGFLDDVYATLVAKLVYCGAFELKELWRDAADFETLAGRRTMGIKLLRNEDGRGTLLVHYGAGVPVEEQVIFANYIHEHLKESATDARRLRFYVCPHCDWPVKDGELALLLLEEAGERAEITCQRCKKQVRLWDELEKRFAGEEVRQKVAALQSRERFELDSRRKGKLLALEVSARITSADQKCFEIPGTEDEGLDVEVEFTDGKGRGTGKRIYLQLKSGNSYLTRRKGDGAEIFRIKEQGWVQYWVKQDRPVLLVVGTFPEETEELRGGGKERFAEIRWMEVGELLRRESEGGAREVKQIVFRGEPLDTMAVREWRLSLQRHSRHYLPFRIMSCRRSVAYIFRALCAKQRRHRNWILSSVRRRKSRRRVYHRQRSSSLATWPKGPPTALLQSQRDWKGRSL